MSRTTPPTSTKTEEFVWPEFNPSPGYRGFIERLRLARIDKGLSIADMSDAVGLTFRLAHEREWDERQDQKQSNPQASCITSTKAGAPDETASELSRSPRNVGWLSPLRALVERFAHFFLSRLSTPEKTPE